MTDAEMLAAYQQAETLVLAGKTAQWGDRLLTMANLEEIRAGRLEYERRIANGTGIRYQRATFR